MIEQVLNRDFVLYQLERTAEALAVLEPREAAELETIDLERARQAVALALAAERQSSSGQHGFEPPAAMLRSDEPRLDDVAFVSRDAVVSNLQSALEEVFATRTGHEVTRLGDSGGDGGDADVPVTDRTLRGYAPRREADGRRVFDRFSTLDARWVASALAMGLRRRFTERHPLVDPPAPTALPPRTRLILVGDWGSGLPRARAVAAAMGREVAAARRESFEPHVVHLGDIYYSGWPRECRERFLDPWPVSPGDEGAVGSFCLAGNHDYYSGGYGYFDFVLRDRRFARQGQASFFALDHPRYRILGLDTGWDEGTLAAPQPPWVREEAARAAAAGQRLVLLSHHQPFSAYEEVDLRLILALAPVLRETGVWAWFWGHEHRCAAYGPQDQVRHGRCLGHGGIPVHQWRKGSDPLPAGVTYEHRGRFRRGLEYWARFGFGVLELDGDRATLRCLDELGEERHREELG